MDTPVEPMLDYVKRCLEETKGRWPDVASGADVSISTLRKIAQGQIVDPSVGKVQKLADYFRQRSSEVSS